MSRHSNLQQDTVELTAFERLLINELQGGFPISTSPFHDLGARLGCDPQAILDTVTDLLDRGVLTRFGPLLNIEKAGGVFSLCALEVPEDRFDTIADQVNAREEVAHNYRRQHRWNMWFVLAAESESELLQVFDSIVTETGCPGLNLPKEKEFYVGLQLRA